MAVRGENSLYFSTALDNSGLQRGAFDAVGIIQGLAGQISKLNPFASLAIGATAAFAIVGKQAYEMMKDFESAMTEVKTIANVSETEFAKLEKRVFGLYKELGTESAAGLARGLYDIIGAGYEASEALDMLKIASKAATAGITTSAVASDGLTTILNAFQLEASDAAEVADIMFATVDRGKISFEELSSQIAQVAPLAASSGFSFAEVAGAVATLTKQGVPAAQAMTQIRSAIVSVGEVMGVGVSKTMTLQAAFQAMYDQAGGDQNNLKELAGRIEAVSGILAIAGPNFKGATEDLIAMGEAAGSVDRSFKLVTGTTENQWKIFSNRVKATTEELGESLVAVSNKFAGFMNKALDDSDDLVASVRRQANEFNVLKTTLEDVNTPFEERVDILKRLKDQYPEYLQSLDLDKVKNDNLEQTLVNVSGALKSINDEQERRIRLSGINQREQEAQAAVDEYRSLKEQAQTEFFDAVEDARDYAAKNNIPLNFSLSDDIGDIYTQISKAFENEGAFSAGTRIASDLLLARKSISTYSGLLNDANKGLETTVELSQRLRRETYDNEKGYVTIVEEIKKIQDLSKLEPYKLYEYPEIQEAYKFQRDLLNIFEKIKLAENVESLEPFLNHELKQVRDFAAKYKRMLNTGGGGGKTDIEGFKEMLKEREKQYKEYEAAVKQGEKEIADREFQSLLSRGRSYGEFLQNLIKESRSASEKIAIAMAAESSGVNLNRNADALKIDSGITPQGLMEVQLDTTSISFYRRQIADLNKQIEVEQDENKRRELQLDREKWEEKLSLAEGGSQSLEDLQGDLVRRLQDYTNAELRNERAKWQKLLSVAKKGTDAYNAIVSMLGSVEMEINARTADTIRGVSSALGEASNMFRKFGEDGIGDALDKMGVMANGAATIAANIGESMTSGNWLGIASGVISMIGGLFSGGKDKGPSDYEMTILRLEGAIKRLGNEIQYAFGQEAIRLQEEQLETYLEKLRALESELEEMERLGSSSNMIDLMIFSGRGGQERIEELRNEISDLNSEFRNASLELLSAG